MINLWTNAYGIGIQSATQYYRSGGGYAWYLGGTHSDTQNDPGAGGTRLMYMDSAGNLVITGNVSAANLSGTNTGDSASGGGSGVSSIANVGAAPNSAGGSITGTVLTLQPASASFPGLVSTTTQAFVGNKTFQNNLGVGGTCTVTGVLTALKTFPGYVDDGVPAGSSASINWNTANFHAIGINNNTTFSFIAPSAMCMVYFDIFAGNTVNVTWPASVRGNPPVSISAGRNLVVGFLYDGSQYYYYMGGANNVLGAGAHIGPDPSREAPQLMLAEDLGQTIQ
jgi:hypothetical protein